MSRPPEIELSPEARDDLYLELVRNADEEQASKVRTGLEQARAWLGGYKSGVRDRDTPHRAEMFRRIEARGRAAGLTEDTEALTRQSKRNLHFLRWLSAYEKDKEGRALRAQEESRQGTESADDGIAGGDEPVRGRGL